MSHPVEVPIDNEDKDLHTITTQQAYVQVNESTPSDSLGPVPQSKFNLKKTIKSFGSKDAWFGDYVSLLIAIRSDRTDKQDYAALFIPNIPFFVKEKRELPFYGINDKLPYLLIFILGLQQ